MRNKAAKALRAEARKKAMTFEPVKEVITKRPGRTYTVRAEHPNGSFGAIYKKLKKERK